MTINPTTQPTNTPGIMQDMFSKMVKPDDAAKPLNSSTAQQSPAEPVKPAQAQSTQVQPAQAQPAQTSPVVTPPVAPSKPIAAQPSVESKEKIETNFFTDDNGDSDEGDVPLETSEPVVEEEPDMSDVPESPAAENFKKMREALKADRKALKARERELAKVQAERDEWATGKKIPDVLTAKDTRIQELEKIETMVNGKLSQEYNELVVQPAAKTKEDFTKLAESYGVSENIREALVQKIVETENEKDRNALITKYFPDAIGGSKAKELVTKMHELGQFAIDMEKKPLETQQTLQSKYAEKMKVEDEKRATVFENISKTAWNAAIEKTAKDSIYRDLILDPTNPEHNKLAEKNQHRAAIQYGAVVKELFQNGLKTLPDKVAQGLARSILLSIGGVAAFEQLERVTRELAEIKQSSSVQTTYFRPSPNGNGHSAPANRQPDTGPRSPEEAAKRASESLKR